MVNAPLPVGDAAWKGAPCLGCDGKVSVRRDPYVIFNGPQDGSLLIVTHAEPDQHFATRPSVPADLTFYQLGIAHRDCSDRARQRLETGRAPLPDVLPIVNLEALREGLDLPPTDDCCPFCGDCQELSSEDVYPLWVTRRLVRRYGKLKLPTPYGPRDITSVNIKVPIGRVCNNEWLSVLENDTRAVMEPMIFGPAADEPPCRMLTPADQQILATWAVKTALMFDLGTHPQAIPRYFYEQLRLYRRALPNTVVFLGANRGHSRAIRVAHGGLKLGTEPGVVFDAFMTVITVFRVVFKVMGGLGPSFPQNVTYTSAYMDGLHRIWPPNDGGIEWPRGGMAFNDQALIAFESELPRFDVTDSQGAA
jgi:hypothetical protein